MREKLLELQAELGLAKNDAAFARHLKVPRSTWLAAKRKDRPVGVALERAAVRAFPVLRDLVVARRLADLTVPGDVTSETNGHDADAPSVAEG